MLAWMDVVVDCPWWQGVGVSGSYGRVVFVLFSHVPENTLNVKVSQSLDMRIPLYPT